MSYEVTGVQPLNFYPADTVTEVIQNVRMILATQKGTVPYDRDFGLEWRFLDHPADIASARLTAEVINQIRKYEPRAKVVRVNIDQASDLSDGLLRPRVVIEVNE